jgi:hypothetical protein
MPKEYAIRANTPTDPSFFLEAQFFAQKEVAKLLKATV